MTTTTITDRRITPGNKLDNGSIILAVREHSNGGYVVLCDTNGRAGNQYATWRCTNREDTSWGHYFDDIVRAAGDFASR